MLKCQFKEPKYHLHDSKKIHVCQLSYLLCCKTMGFSSFVTVGNYACRRPFMRFLLTDLFWSFEEIGNLKDGNRIEFYSY